VFCNLIRAGEASGQLPDVLASLTESLKWEDELATHTKKLLMYPAFVATIVLSATFFLMVYMVPQLKLFVKNMGHALPPHTQVLFFVSDLLVNYWAVFLLLPIIALIAGQLVLRSNPLARTRLDGIKLRLPVVGPILKKIILSRFANTFAMLYASGIPGPRVDPHHPADRRQPRRRRRRWSGSSNRSAKARTWPAPSATSACSRRSSCACCASAKAPAASTRPCSTSATFTTATSRNRSARPRR
jgi:hypothetical protein